MKGKLNRKNATVDEAGRYLSITVTDFAISTIGKRSFIAAGIKPLVSGERSYYFDKFEEGATIVPRAFWFVDIKRHPHFGFNPQMPYVITGSRAQERAKKEYAGVKLDGNVESTFLYATLTGSELVPFNHLPFLPIVLPVKPARKRYEIVDKQMARGQGVTGLVDWLNKAERTWGERRGVKESKLTIFKRLDYAKGITNQNPDAKFKVLYLMSGTNLASCVTDLTQKIEINVDGAKLPLHGFVADYKTFYLETEDAEEAYFLTSILKSRVVDAIIKPMQTRGLFGERDICKKVLELPIPKFSSRKATHKKLAELGKQCTEKVREILPTLTHYKSIAKIRGKIRRVLSKELQEIDELVKRILS